MVKLDLWENYISKFQVGHCYSISPVQVRSWLGNKKISTLVYSDVVEVKDKALLYLTSGLLQPRKTKERIQ
jgi:hypothetical protein